MTKLHSGVLGASVLLWTLGAAAEPPPDSPPANAATAPSETATVPPTQPGAPPSAAGEPGAPAAQPAYGGYPQPAQPAYGGYPPPAQPGYPQAPLPPAARAEADPSIRNHDGFFLRMSLGFGPGYGTEKATSAGTTYTDLDITGTAAMFDLMLGGSPTPGLTLGGIMMSHRLFGLTLKDQDGNEQDVDSDITLTTAVLGGFVVFYPDPKGGLNLHALLGYGTRSISDDSGDTSDSDTNPDGLVLGGGIGYDFFVSDQWSLGPDLRVTYMDLSTTVAGVKLDESYIIPTLSFTATYH